MKSLCKSIVSFFVILSCTAVYCMEKDKKIFMWDKNSIEKIISQIDKTPTYANIQDDAGQTPLLFLLVNNKYKDCSRSKKVYGGELRWHDRNYTYNPNVLKKIITITDLNIKNSENKTFFDYFLRHTVSYNVRAVNSSNENIPVYINSDYPYTEKKSLFFQGFDYYATTENGSYELFKWLLFAALKSGYSFLKNPQTTLELVGNTFDSVEAIKNLIQQGIAGGSTLNYFKDEIINTLRYKCLKYENSIQNSEKLKRLIEQEDNPDFLLLLFSRAVSRNQPILLRLLCEELPKIFTPLYGFQRASELNQHASLYYILQSFSPLTLRNLLLKMCSVTTATLKSKFDEELYKSCKEAESSGHHKFCNKVAAIAALRCYRKNKRSLPPEIIAHILEYVDL